MSDVQIPNMDDAFGKNRHDFYEFCTSPSRKCRVKVVNEKLREVQEDGTVKSIISRDLPSTKFPGPYSKTETKDPRYRGGFWASNFANQPGGYIQPKVQPRSSSFGSFFDNLFG